MVFGGGVIGQRQRRNRHGDRGGRRRRHRGGADPNHQQGGAERRRSASRDPAARDRPFGPLHRIERPIEVVIEDDAAGVERSRGEEQPREALRMAEARDRVSCQHVGQRRRDVWRPDQLEVAAETRCPWQRSLRTHDKRTRAHLIRRGGSVSEVVRTTSSALRNSRRG